MNDSFDTNSQTTGLETQSKRRRQKRGKRTNKTKDIETGSSDSNVIDADIQDYEDIDENTIVDINNCRLDDETQINSDKIGNYYGIRTDALVSQSSVETETPQYQNLESNINDNTENEIFDVNNLISDDNINIFTDGMASSCIKSVEPSLSSAKTEVYAASAVPKGSVGEPTSPTFQQGEEELYNSKALPRTASTYQLETFAKNVLIIFNQKTFYEAEERTGTDQDVQALKSTFEAFDFVVLPYTDRTKSQIMDILEAVKKQDFTDYGCVGIVVLTHGNENGELLTKDDKYTEMDIINSLKTHRNPSLISKPRLLIIQACRGTNAIAGVPVLRRGRIRTDLKYDTEPYTLPVEADMLVLHSSYAGNPAHRHETEGSWFIQTLCKKINEMAPTHDLESILIEVKRDVAIDKEHCVRNRIGGVDVNKQIPVVTSTLIRRLYLRKYCDGGDDAASNMKDMCTGISVDSSAAENSSDKCACRLKYFSYIKSCLRYYLEGNPEDSGARSLLELTETFQSEAIFDSAKEKCAVAISHHLDQNAKNADYYKYLHIYRS